MIVPCPKCKFDLDVGAGDVGKRIRCPTCDFPFKPEAATEGEEAIGMADAPPSSAGKKAGNEAFLHNLNRKLAEEKAWTRRTREGGLRETIMSGATLLGGLLGFGLVIGVGLLLWSQGIVIRGRLAFGVVYGSLLLIGTLTGAGLGAGFSKLMISLDRSREAAKVKKKKSK